MSWSDILKEDRSNNNVWIEYTFNGETKNIGPFKFPDFDKEFNAVPTLATNIRIIEKRFTKDGKYLGEKLFEPTRPSRILKDAGDAYIAEAARMIKEMASLIEKHAELVGDVYELADKNGDKELTGMIFESSSLLDEYIETQMDMINRLNEREERR